MTGAVSRSGVVRRSAALVAAAITFAACGTIQVEPLADEGPATLAFADESPELSWALVRPDTVDPHAVSLVDQDAVIVSDLLYDGLTELGPSGALRPALATTWESTDEARVWTFTLDTDRVNAADVVASFDRLRTGHPSSPAAALLADVASIEAVGESQVRFELVRSTAGLAWILSGLPFSVVPADEAPTGRFRLVDDDAGAALASITEDRSIEITWVADHSEAAALLDAGDVTGAVVDDPAAVSSIEGVGTARSISRFFVLHPQSDALADVRTRRAVVAAVDAGPLAEVSGAGAFTADGLVAPTVAGFEPGACAEVCETDPSVAQSLVEQFGPLPALRVGYSGAGQVDLATTLAEQLTAAGFGVEVVEFDTVGLADAVADGTVDVFAFGWTAPAGTIDAVVPALLGQGSPVNVFGPVDPRVQGLLDEAARTLEPHARWSLLHQAQELALAEAVVIPVSNAGSGFVFDVRAHELAVRADGSIVVGE